jgi:hypothetical protein
MKPLTRSPQRSASTESDLQNAPPWEENRNLELIPTEQTGLLVRSSRSIRNKSILTLIQNLWQDVITALMKEPEVKIWQKQDRHGNIYWHAHDPLMRKSVSFISELEMLKWLDNQYGRW